MPLRTVAHPVQIPSLGPSRHRSSGVPGSSNPDVEAFGRGAGTVRECGCRCFPAREGSAGTFHMKRSGRKGCLDVTRARGLLPPPPLRSRERTISPGLGPRSRSGGRRGPQPRRQLRSHRASGPPRASGAPSLFRLDDRRCNSPTRSIRDQLAVSGGESSRGGGGGADHPLKGGIAKSVLHHEPSRVKLMAPGRATGMLPPQWAGPRG